jgi:WD40 repeat protein
VRGALISNGSVFSIVKTSFGHHTTASAESRTGCMHFKNQSPHGILEHMAIRPTGRPTIAAAANQFLLGDDVFISYSRRDAANYAMALSSELAQKGYSCYLDQTSSEPGLEFPPTLLRALERSSMMVLIATEAAGRSANVDREIRVFRARGGRPRPLIVIDVDGAVESANWKSLIEGAPRNPETIEMVADGVVHESVLRRALAAATFVRRNQRLRNVGAGLLLLIGCLAGAAGLLFRETLIQQARASDQAAQADNATARAKEEEARRQRALDDARAAERQRDEAVLAKTDATQEKDRAQGEAKLAAADAVRSRKFSESVQLAQAANRVVETSPETALELAVRGMTAAESPEAQGALIRASAAFVPFRRIGVDGARSIAFSRDGELVSLPGRNDEIGLWNVRTARLVSKHKFSFWPASVGFTASDNLVIQNYFLGEPPFLWKQGSAPAKAAGTVSGAYRSAISRDGQRIAAVDVRLLSLWVWRSDGTLLRQARIAGAAKPNEKDVNPNAFLAFLADSKRVLSVSSDGRVYLLDTDSAQTVASARLSPGRVQSFALRPQADLFALTIEEQERSSLSEVQLWQTTPLERSDNAEGCSRGEDIDFSADGRWLGVGHLHDGVKICSISSSSSSHSSYSHLTYTISHPELRPVGIAFSPKGSRLLIRDLDGDARLYDLSDRRGLCVLRAHGQYIDDAYFHPGGELVVAGLKDGAARVYDLGLGIDSSSMQEPESATGRRVRGSLSPDGRTLLAGSATRGIWRIDSQLRPVPVDPRPRGTADEYYPESFNWDATGSQVIAVPAEGAATLFDTASWKPTELSFVSEARLARSDRRGLYVAAPEGDNIGVWNVTTKTLLVELKGGGHVYDIAVSPDGSLIAAMASPSGTHRIGLFVWDRVSGKLVFNALGDHSQPRRVLFDRSGSVLAATAEGDRALTSWNVLRKNQKWSFDRRAIIRQSSGIWDIAVGAGGRHLASWGFGTGLRIWDAETSTLIKDIPTFLSPDGQVAFTGAPVAITTFYEARLRTYGCRACRPTAELFADARRELAQAAAPAGP